MWGFGGRYYWGRKERDTKVEGIVVIFAWMSSQDRHVKGYVQLYSSFNWNSLVCHSEFLNQFFPQKAMDLAFDILTSLIEELKIKPCPVVFAPFSGGPKACMYKVLQIIEGTCEARHSLDDYRLVRDCISGHIFDSSPVDFTSDIGTRFVLSPTVLKTPQPPRIASWIAHGIASGLDALFLNRFESQRAEYWQTLYSSVSMRAPYLIFCSEKDDLAPYHIICNFAQRLVELGADVKLVKWNGSPHVGHYRFFPDEYTASVAELLGKAARVYSQRIRIEGERTGISGMLDDISNPISVSQKAATRTSDIQRCALGPGDRFLLPGSMEYFEGGSMHDERNEDLFHLSCPPAITAHGILDQLLIDLFLPKNVEGWEIRPSSSLNALPSNNARRQGQFNHPIKCIRRSRL